MREIKFRAWDGKQYISHDSLCCPSFSLGEILYGNGFIVEQFTGLHDKNGKEIYEGDIVQYIVGEIIKEKHIVEYEAFGISPFYETDADGNPWNPGPEECEVVGNIHDNPELLK